MPRPTPEEALKRLIKGNLRFENNQPALHGNLLEKRARLLKEGQHPIAAVLGCSDSRVPPEILFDQNIGDLFIVRTAGHVLCQEVLESLEYAAEHLQVALLIVLGHSQCGAVSHICNTPPKKTSHTVLGHYLSPCVEAVDASSPGLPSRHRVDAAIRENIRQTLQRLHEGSPLLRGLAQAAELQMHGAYYALDTGRVEWLS